MICPRFHKGEPGPYCTRCGGKCEPLWTALIRYPRRKYRWQRFKHTLSPSTRRWLKKHGHS